MAKFIKLSQQVTKSLPEIYAKVPKDLLKYIDREQVVKNLPKVLPTCSLSIYFNRSLGTFA